MQKTLVLLIALLFINGSFSQSACADGTITPPTAGSDPQKGKCLLCFPYCKTCSSPPVCTAFIDKIKGLTSGAPICSGGLAYNSAKDVCDFCIDGCASCIVDYNVCLSCKVGWDFDRTNGQCLRATLGLAAVVLALSVLTLLIGVISCICACKL